MTERKPSQIARLFAVLALVLAGILVIGIVLTTEGDGDGNGDDEEKETNRDDPTRRGQRALEEGVWIVREGDTLVRISEATAIDIDELEELNPDIDPQTLNTGQRVALVGGLANGAAPSDSADGVAEGSGIGDGTGEGDGGPSVDDPDEVGQ